MDVFGRVVAHPLEIESLEDRERLEENRPLAPKPGFEDLKSPVTRPKREASRLLDPAPILREILRRQKPARVLNGAHDPLADIALVETVARGVDRRPAALPTVSLLFRRERTKGPGELRLAEHAADGGHRASGALKVHARAARIAPHIFELPGKEAPEELVPGEAVLGQRDRRRENLGQGECAKLGERDRQRIDDCRDGSGERTARRNLS